MHTRTSDEKILMQFAEDQGFDIPEVIDAVERLKICHKEDLQDYASNDENFEGS